MVRRLMPLILLLAGCQNSQFLLEHATKAQHAEYNADIFECEGRVAGLGHFLLGDTYERDSIGKCMTVKGWRDMRRPR